MFVGHVGAGMALKALAPRLNLGVLVFLSLFPDMLLGLLALAGLERIVVPDDYPDLGYLHFVFPWSHGLLATAAWAALAAALVFAVARPGDDARRRAALAAAAAVLLHWAGDWIEHPPQLPLLPGRPATAGLGLWNHLELAVGLEAILVAIGVALYLKAATGPGRRRRIAWAAVVASISALALAGQLTVRVAPAPMTVAASLPVQALLLSALAWWVDRGAAPAPR